MCKSFEFDPPLPEDEPQAETSEEPAIPLSPLKRKGKEVASGVPKKKSKPSVQTGGGLKIGGKDNPPPTISCRPTRSVASASRPTEQIDPKDRTPPCQAAPPSPPPRLTTKSAQTPTAESAPAPRAPKPPKRAPDVAPTDCTGSGTKKPKLKLKKGPV